MASQSAGTRSNTAPIPINANDYNVGADDDDEVEIKREWDADAEVYLDDDGPDPAIIKTISQHLSRQLSTVSHRKLQIINESVRDNRRYPMTKHHVRLADFLSTYHTWASCYLDRDDRGLSDSIEDIASEFADYTMKHCRGRCAYDAEILARTPSWSCLEGHHDVVEDLARN